jgi:hypothetical protein
MQEVRMKALDVEEKAEIETKPVPNRKFGIILIFLMFLPGIPGIILWTFCSPSFFIEKYVVVVTAFALFAFTFREINIAIRTIQ